MWGASLQGTVWSFSLQFEEHQVTYQKGNRLTSNAERQRHRKLPSTVNTTASSVQTPSHHDISVRPFSTDKSQCFHAFHHLPAFYDYIFIFQPHFLTISILKCFLYSYFTTMPNCNSITFVSSRRIQFSVQLCINFGWFKQERKRFNMLRKRSFYLQHSQSFFKCFLFSVEMFSNYDRFSIVFSPAVIKAQ